MSSETIKCLTFNVLLISDTDPRVCTRSANEDFTLPFDYAIDWVANNWCLGKKYRHLQLITVPIPDLYGTFS